MTAGAVSGLGPGRALQRRGTRTGLRGCVRGFQVTERRGQEARPGQYIYKGCIWKSGMSGNLTLSLSLRVGWEEHGGPDPGTSCMPASLTWGAAVRPSSAAPPTLHFWPLLLPRLSTVRSHLCPADAQIVSPVTLAPSTVASWVHTDHVQRKIISLSQWPLFIHQCKSWTQLDPFLPPPHPIHLVFTAAQGTPG